ncbi:MAG TPA: glycine cleavage system protein H [Clostridia bacterium]|nr:glycine cleavage system protein H [Clostridia bacterium]
MTVILVLFTFVAFLLIDFFFSRNKQAVFVPEQVVRHDATLPRPTPKFVGGFQIPENLRYHPGHTWALSESPNLVRVGVDDFASKILGNVESVALPQRGQWIRQGQKLMSFNRHGETVDMVSPIEGSVADVNENVLRNPETAGKDPYGEGWLITVQSPDAKTNFKNLMGGGLARWWTEEAAVRLQKKVPTVMGSLALAQDGGVATDALANEIPEKEWAAVAREFFLT